MGNVTKDDILAFYESGIFRRELKNTVDKAAERAYRDLCRTIDFPDEWNAKTRTEGKLKGYDELREQIGRLNAHSQGEYDEWLKSTSTELTKIYGDFFHFGHAQKWINMTMKYLLCFGFQKVVDHKQYLHAPVDTYVVEAAFNEYKISKEGLLPWSKIGCEGQKEELYFKFQEALKNAVESKYGSAIKWEFSAWSNYEKQEAQ